MEKNNENNSEGKKVNSKKMLILIIIAVVIIIITMIIIKLGKKNTVAETAENVVSNESSSDSKIDLSNMENAEVKDGVKVNVSEKAHEEKTYGNLKFSDLSLNSADGETNFVVNVTNVGEKKSKEQYVKITCVDKDEKEIGQLYLLVSELDPDASINASATTSEDYINLYDYKIEKQ